MFASVVEAGKLERALDLVERLHLEKSFDLAMTIADNHQKLVDLVEDAKYRKFGEPTVDDEPAYTDDAEYSGGYDEEEADYDAQKITPDSASFRKRTTGDFLDDDQEQPRAVRRKQVFA